MAMMGLSTEKCGEILEAFRRILPDIPDDLLKELAGNYALDAFVDIDETEICELLEIHGPRLVLRNSFMGDCCIDKSLKRLFSNTTTGGIDLTTVAGMLLMVKVKPNFPLMNISTYAYECETQFLHPRVATRLGLYRDASLKTDYDALVIFTGIGTSHEVLATRVQIVPKESGADSFDLPAFLRKP
jgi:hypothetical protein